jgi:hypothetical protein
VRDPAPNNGVMTAPATPTADPVALVRSLDPAAIRQRLAELDATRRALLTLLRAARAARPPDAPAAPVSPRKGGSP